MAAYYNEFDPKAAAWLRELIKQGHIADGVVDDRSIEDVTPTELAGFTQCHFFAGIGVWSYALRRAGWADDRAVWTGSCPCQPFSAAGKGAGFADERHLWPAFHHLISQCRPPIVLGEQVASKDGLGWLDLVQSDLEATGYASGAVDLCAAGVGAPHIRQRLWWVGERLANAKHQRWQGDVLHSLWNGRDRSGPDGGASGSGPAIDMADAVSPRLQGREWRGPTGTQGSPSGYGSESGGSDGLADTDSDGRGAGYRIRSDGQEHDVEHGGGEGGLENTLHTERRPINVNGANGRNGQDAGRQEAHGITGTRGEICGRPSPTNGHWRDADWLFCRDGKWRPVEPGTSPLAHGSAARVGRLRGYGNAIVAQAAQAFIESVM